MRRAIEQFLAIFNSLAPSQRVTFVGIAFLVPMGFVWFAWNGASSSMVPLSYGKVFSLDEQRNAEQALKEAGHSNFRSDGRQILAPASDVEKYNAALLQSGSLPSHWAEELEKKMEGASALMMSSDTTKQMREALLGKHLRRMIIASSDFEDAEIFWAPANSGRSRFSKDSKMKATVAVKPRNGREMSLRQVQALRDAVTSAIPDLKASDVTVYDQRKGESYTPESDDDPLGSKTLAVLREYSHYYEKKIRDDLMRISPDVLVAVNAEIDPLQRSITQSVKFDSKKSVDQQKTEQTRTEKFKQQPVAAEPGAAANQSRALKTAPGNTQDRSVEESTTTTARSVPFENTYTEQVPGLPKVVSVAVSIPDDYYAKALEQQKAAQTQSKSGGSAKTIDDIKKETQLTVKNIVAAAIPNGDPEKVNVGSYFPDKVEPIEIKTSFMETATSLLSQWGSAVGLGLFAIWALWLLRGTTQKTAAIEPPPTASVNVASGAAIPSPKVAEELVLEDDSPQKLNDRDIVQSMARDNPEMAAAIIGKWLQTVR